MNANDLAGLLDQLSMALDELTAPWGFIGSGALMMTGAPIAECPDLDIVTTSAGAAELERRWAPWRTPAYLPDPSSRFRSRFSRYQWPQGPVEVMGDLAVRRHGHWAPVEVKEQEVRVFGSRAWPVPTIEEHRRLLQLIGRPKDLEKLHLLRDGG